MLHASRNKQQHITELRLTIFHTQNIFLHEIRTEREKTKKKSASENIRR